MYDKPLPCVFTHLYGCPCLFDDKFSDKLSKRQFFRVLNSYLQGLYDLVDSGRYDSRPDFTVVIQPTLVNVDFPKYRPRRGARLQPNPDYLAPDCFHWAQKTHAKGNVHEKKMYALVRFVTTLPSMHYGIAIF